jgi:hypothetical protein
MVKVTGFEKSEESINFSRKLHSNHFFHIFIVLSYTPRLGRDKKVWGVWGRSALPYGLP